MIRQEPFTSFSESDIAGTQPVMKIGLLATVSPQGLPHVTMISTLMACSPTQLVFGQFAEGLSKQHIRDNHKVGFLIMGLDKQLWRGKADFAHSAREGREYDQYNNVATFRYNAYFGVHTVHYFDLLCHSGRQALPMGRIVVGSVLTRLARWMGGTPAQQTVLNPWTQSFLNTMGNLKFLTYVREDGYPHIIPAIQSQCLNAEQVLFATTAYREELLAIPKGTPLAVFALSLSMEDVLVRGTYQGLRRIDGVPSGVVGVDWVYNSMPPTPGQVYPPRPLKAIAEFVIDRPCD